MTLRLIPDPEDDSMAANPEPHIATGYETTAEPRRRARPAGAPTRWSFVELPGAPESTEAGPIGGANRCKPRSASLPGCGESAPVLHADPRSSGPERTLCSRCTGDVMRDRVGDVGAAVPTDKPRGDRR